MKSSVIIPAHNAERTLPGCLAALAHQEYPDFEVIVVDDASTDATCQIAEKAGVKVIRLAQKRGPAAARNIGVAHSTGEILCFTDADCEPDPTWLIHLLAPFEQDIQVMGAKGVYRLKTRHLVARFVQREYEMRYRRMRRFERIDFIDTYSAAYRREIFEAAGGFDEGYSAASVEDQDLSFRIAAMGAKLVFVPEAVVAHHHVTTWTAYARRKYRIGYWKMRLLRHMPNKAIHDSHTPLTLKLQIGLAALLSLSTLAGFFHRRFFVLSIGFTGLFFGSARDFAWYVYQTDKSVLLIFPFLLVIRAFALGIGMVAGFFEFRVKPYQRG